MDPTVSKVCADAMEVIVARGSSSMHWLPGLLLIGCAVCFCATYLMLYAASRRLDDRLAAQRKDSDRIMEAHKECSRLMLGALRDPLARVTLVFDTDGRWLGVQTKTPAGHA